jgi:uncharacterized protein YjlB
MTRQVRRMTMNPPGRMTSPGKPVEPETFMFKDDGWVPNNPTLPLLVYKASIDIVGVSDPESLMERTFKANGWGYSMWRNGIYPYIHYHSMIHEALGIARDRARLRFGGTQGEEVDLSAGDVAVLPAGTGHQNLWSTADLSVIGAYPPQGTYNLCRVSKAEHDEALRTIGGVPVPTSDPVLGAGGPLCRLWQA